MAIAVLAAELVDLPDPAPAGPPIVLNASHTVHSSATFLYVVLAAATGNIVGNVPTVISAVWDVGGTNQALTQHLNNFVASTNRAVAWTGWLRAPTTGAHTLRFTLNDIGVGFACVFYDLSGVLGTGNPYAAVSHLREETLRAADTASTTNITVNADGQSLVLCLMNLGGPGESMSYSAPSFTTVITGIFGGSGGSRCQQTHRYRLSATGTVTVSQTMGTGGDRRHGIMLVELRPGGPTSVGTTLSESASIAANLDRRVVWAPRGLTEAASVTDSRFGELAGTGDPQRPAATWSGAVQVYDTKTATEIKSGRALSVASGVSAATMGPTARPGASFPSNAAALYEPAPSNLALSNYTIEGWIEPTTGGRLMRLAAPGSNTSKISLQVLGGSAPATPVTAPYPLSQKWQQITFPNTSASTFTRILPTSDQHHTTPYIDGMCDIACDWTTPAPDTTLEIVRLTGTFPDGLTVTRRANWGTGVEHGTSNAENLKCHAVVCLGNNNLLLWYYTVFNPTEANHSCCILSTDNGVNFPALPAVGTTVFTQGAGEDFQPRGILQPSYAAAVSDLPPNTEPQYFDTDYFYIAGNNQTQGGAPGQQRPGGLIYLCRYKFRGTGGSLVTADLRNRGRYSFFKGVDANGVPQWTADGGLKTEAGVVPIFSNIINGSNVGVTYFWQCHWHPLLQQWIAAWIPGGAGTGVSIAHAPVLWDNSWQMLANNVQPAGVSPDESGFYLAASCPARWSTATRLGMGLSTFVPSPRLGDDLILTTSSDLVALAAPTDSSFVLTRTTASGAQVSTSAVGATPPIGGPPLHFCAAFASGQNAALYINGEPVILTHSGAAPTGALVIATGDEIVIGRQPSMTGHIGMIGKVSRVSFWPTAWSAARAKTVYRQQADAIGNMGLGGENLANDSNRSAVAVPSRETAVTDVSKTFDVRPEAYDPDGDMMAVTGTPTTTSGTVTVASGNLVYRSPAGFEGAATINFSLKDASSKISDSLIRVAVAPQVVVPPDSIPADFGLTVPTFNGPFTTVTNRGELDTALAATPASGNDIRIICKAGNYSSGSPVTVTINRPGIKVQIVGENAPFASLTTTKRNDLTLTSATSTNAQDKVVVGPIRAATDCVNMVLAPQSASVLWIENFYFLAGQQLHRQNLVSCDVWVRRCRFRESEGHIISLGSPTQTAQRIILWEAWLYGDGSRRGTGNQSQAQFTDYGMQMYQMVGIFIYKSFFEGGMSHMISPKRDIGKMMYYDTIFMPWTNDADSSYTSVVTLEGGQEGSAAGEDRTCGMATIRRCTFGSWTTGRRSGLRLSHCIFQDVYGMIIDDCMFYGHASQDDYALRVNRLTNSEGNPATNDVGPVWCGDGNVEFTNNTIVARTRILLVEPYNGTWHGTNVHFEQNTVPGGTAIQIDTPIGNQITTTFGTNPGYTR